VHERTAEAAMPRSPAHARDEFFRPFKCRHVNVRMPVFAVGVGVAPSTGRKSMREGIVQRALIEGRKSVAGVEYFQKVDVGPHTVQRRTLDATAAHLIKRVWHVGQPSLLNWPLGGE